MTWDCPHCACGLKIAPGRLGNRWEYARCFRCGGHSIVCAGGDTAIRAERIPVGERILATHPLDGVIPSDLERDREDPGRVSAQSMTDGMRRIPARFVPEVGDSEAACQAPPVELARAIAADEGARRRRISRLAGGALIALGLVLAIQGRKAMKETARARVELPAEVVRLPAPVTRSVSSEPAETPPERPVAPASTQGISDQLRGQVAAPERVTERPPDSAKAIEGLRVQAAKSRIRLRSGPSLQHSVLDRAAAGDRYRVVGWRDRWFEIEEPTPSPRRFWVRNDLVRIAVK